MIPNRWDFAKAATSPGGSGFTHKQVKILGMKPNGEWLKPLLNTFIPDEIWAAFVKAGDARRKRNYEKLGRKLEDGPYPLRTETTRALASGKKPHEEHPSSRQIVAPGTNFISAPIRRQLFESEQWRAMRALVLRLDNYTCQHCGARNVRLHVDHKIPITVDWSRRLDLLNLQVLCEDCNVGKSNFFVG
jgi:hypothetical protein